MNFVKFLNKKEQFGINILNSKGTAILNHKNKFFPVDSVTFLAEHCISNPEFECNCILTVGDRQTGKTTGLLRCALKMALSHDNYKIAFVCTNRISLKNTSDTLYKLIDEFEQENNLNITSEILITKCSFINGSTIYFKLPKVSDFTRSSFNCLIIDDAELLQDENDEFWYSTYYRLSEKRVILAAMDTKYSRENSIVKHFI